LIKEAAKRAEVFRNLPSYLKELKNFSKKIDKKCKIFIFGSVVEKKHALISDVDILILTSLKPSIVISKLRKAGFDEPFEFHVVDKKMFKLYKSFIPKLKKI
jgi:predicted nucleotidyltransferase